MISTCDFDFCLVARPARPRRQDRGIEERPIRRLGVTRRALFEELDRPNLKSLPAEPYCFAEWRVRRVGVDYHVELDGHFYSVPYRFARSEVEVRLTPRAVEVF
jgi:transposase